MLHACTARFDVTGNLEKFWKLNNALAYCPSESFCHLRLADLPLPTAVPRTGFVR